MNYNPAIEHFRKKGLVIRCPNTPQLCNATMFEPVDAYNVDLLHYLLDKQREVFKEKGHVYKIHVYRNINEREFQYDCIGTTDGLKIAKHFHVLHVNKFQPMEPATGLLSDHLNYYIAIHPLKKGAKRFKDPYVLGAPLPEDRFMGIEFDPMPGSPRALEPVDHHQKAIRYEAHMAEIIAKEIFGPYGKFSWKVKVIKDPAIVQELNAMEHNADGTLTLNYPLGLVSYPSVKMTSTIKMRMKGNAQSILEATVIIQSTAAVRMYEKRYTFKPNQEEIINFVLDMMGFRVNRLTPGERHTNLPRGKRTRNKKREISFLKEAEDFMSSQKASTATPKRNLRPRREIAEAPVPKQFRFKQLRRMFRSNVKIIRKQLVVYDSITRKELATALNDKSTASKNTMFSRIPVTDGDTRMEFTLQELRKSLNARVIVLSPTCLWMMDQTSVTIAMIKEELASRRMPTKGSKGVLFDRLYDAIHPSHS